MYFLQGSIIHTFHTSNAKRGLKASFIYNIFRKKIELTRI